MDGMGWRPGRPTKERSGKIKSTNKIFTFFCSHKHTHKHAHTRTNACTKTSHPSVSHPTPDSPALCRIEMNSNYGMCAHIIYINVNPLSHIIFIVLRRHCFFSFFIIEKSCVYRSLLKRILDLYFIPSAKSNNGVDFALAFLLLRFVIVRFSFAPFSSRAHALRIVSVSTNVLLCLPFCKMIYLDDATGGIYLASSIYGSVAPQTPEAHCLACEFKMAFNSHVEWLR